MRHCVIAESLGLATNLAISRLTSNSEFQFSQFHAFFELTFCQRLFLVAKLPPNVELWSGIVLPIG